MKKYKPTVVLVIKKLILGTSNDKNLELVPTWTYIAPSNAFSRSSQLATNLKASRAVMPGLRIRPLDSMSHNWASMLVSAFVN